MVARVVVVPDVLRGTAKAFRSVGDEFGVSRRSVVSESASVRLNSADPGFDVAGFGVRVDAVARRLGELEAQWVVEADVMGTSASDAELADAGVVAMAAVVGWSARLVGLARPVSGVVDEVDGVVQRSWLFNPDALLLQAQLLTLAIGETRGGCPGSC